MSSKKRNIVVIGSSAGGISALKQLMGGLTTETAASYFVVQHIARQSPGMLHQILDQAGPLPVSTAQDGEKFLPGHVYVAGPDRHLLLGDGQMMTTRGPRENRSRPAIDPLFRSAAVQYGPQVIGVILSGTLDDGTAGMQAVKRCGGVAAVQNPSDALYDEMPLSVLEHVDVDHTVDLKDLPEVLLRLTSEECGFAIVPPRDVVLEARMSEAESGSTATTDEIGELAPFTCPECSGPLWQVGDKGFERFRCHTGHVFTAHALASDFADATERSLWVALRTLEERVRMLRRLSTQVQVTRRSYTSQSFANQADELETHVRTIRNLLMEQPPLS